MSLRPNDLVPLGPGLAVFLWLLLMIPAGAAAQNTPPPLPVDPTPLKDLLSPEERSLVAGARGNLKLTDTYLDISDKHLLAAGNASEAGDFTAAERELDMYSKAAAEASNVAFSGNENKNK